jgi:hypothetical protein
MADLFNQQISATYSGLLKTTSSGVLTSSLTQITDGRGNGSPLYISTVAINFYNAYSFPSTDGTADQILSTDGAGAITWVDVSGGDVLKTGTIVANEIAIWNDNDSTLRSDPTFRIDLNHNIALYQPNSVPTDLSNYNIGGGNIPTVTGNYNTGFGKDNLLFVTTGSGNTAIGSTALNKNTTGSTNIAIGYQSMYNNLSGGYNMALGSNALFYNTTGLRNVAIGSQAVQGNTSGSFNIGIGETALQSNTTASYQIAIGANSLYLNNGGYNTAIGYEAIRNNTSGVQNTAIGYQSMLFSTTGDANTAIGYGSGGALTTGSYNVLIGGGNAITTGSSNVVIGRDGGSSIATLSNRIIISDGDGNIRQRFDNIGKLTLSNYGIGTHTGTLANTLGVDSSGNVIEFTSGSGTVTGTGTATTLTKWSTGGTGIEDSIVTDDGTTLTVSGAATFSGTINTNATTELMLSLNTTDANGGYLRMKESDVTKFFIGARGAVSGGTGTGYDIYTAGGNDLRIWTAGSEALKIDTSQAATFSGALSGTSATFSGNVALGTTALSAGGAAQWLTANGTSYGGGLISSVSGVIKAAYYYDNSGYAFVQGMSGVGVNLVVNDSTNALTIASTGAATFSNDVTTTGASQNLFIADGSTYSGFKLNRAGTAKWTIFNNNAGTDFLDFYWYGSSPGTKFKIEPTGAATFSGQINANNGISFPTPSPASSGTVVASVLDAYEEGTWTGTMDNTGTTPAPTATGSYTRIGRIVNFKIYFDPITITTAGNTSIVGLPYSANITNGYSVFTYVHGTVLNNSNGGYISGAYGTALIVIANNTTNYAAWIVGSGKSGMFTGTYTI